MAQARLPACRRRRDNGGSHAPRWLARPLLARTTRLQGNAYYLLAQNRGLATNLYRFKRQAEAATAELQGLRAQHTGFVETASAFERNVEQVRLLVGAAASP